MNSLEKINIKKALSQKNPKLAKYLPRFIIRWIEKIVHVDKLNKAIDDYGDTYGLEFVANTVKYLGASVIVRHEENIPTEGRYIFASNHPLGGLDGIILMDVIGKKCPNIKFIVNDILMNVPNLRPLFIGVNKHGKQSGESVKNIEDTYASNDQILYFPAGMCSRKIKGKIQDLEWKKSFISKAKKHQRDIVPLYVQGYNSNFFYNLSNFRKKLGIKANIEMFFLVDEMFKQNGKTITITFGKPIPYQTFTQNYSDKEWADKLRAHVYKLKDNPEGIF